MPKNNDLTPVTFPMKLRFGEEPTTEFKNDLEAINVELLDYPDPERARKMIQKFVGATWEDYPGQIDPDSAPNWKGHQIVEMCLNFRALPTALETMGFTFRIEGIEFQAVTHLLRHRTFSFAAQCTGDRHLAHDPAVIPGPVQNSPEFLERWKQLVEDSKKLYCDIINSRKISMMDARLCLTKAQMTHYNVRCNIKDLVNFIRQRIDRAVQPTSDNLIAYYMAIEVAKIFPEITSVIDFDAPSTFFVKTARTGHSTNLYWPEPHNDIFDYHPDDFVYQCTRSELNGTDPELGKPENFKFAELKEKCDAEWAKIKEDYDTWKEEVGWIDWK